MTRDTEIEFKYLIEDQKQAEELFRDEYILSLKAGEEETIPMFACFFDTEDLDLMRERIAYRIRLEKDLWVATVKWDETEADPGSGAEAETEEGLHRRHEINCTLRESRGEPEKDMPDPDLQAFRGRDIYTRLERLTEGRVLRPLFSMEYVRTQFRLDTGSSVSVISLDRGRIFSGDREVPVLEMEIELVSGDEDDFLALGQKICLDHGLEPFAESKFARGKALMSP